MEEDTDRFGVLGLLSIAGGVLLRRREEAAGHDQPGKELVNA